MSNVFHVPNLTNKPSRNGFDLSFKNSFTAKCGELLPIMHRSCLPGDKFTIQIQHRTVTLPLKTSAFTRFTEYFDFFYVPYDQIYRQAGRTLTEMTNNPQIAMSPTQALPYTTTLPWFSPFSLFGPAKPGHTSPFFTLLGSSSYTDYQGFNLGLQNLKLYNYLGGSYVSESTVKNPPDIPNSPNVPLDSYPVNRPYSLIPFAAYQKIYFDHYRFDQWENNAPWCYNFDYLTTNTQLTLSQIRDMDPHNNVFTLRHCNWPRDLFFGVLPSPQYGNASLVLSSSWAPGNQINYFGGVPLNNDQSIMDGSGKNNGQIVLSQYDEDNYRSSLFVNGNHTQADDPEEIIDAKIGFSIMQLRQGKALQRYREVIGTGNQDYKSMVKKIWGVDVPAYTSHTVRFLGGFRNVVNVNTIMNNNLSEASSQADMKGYAEGVDEESKPIHFEADEHGIIMCIYRVVPLVDYELDAPHFDLLKTDVDDFANPFFDRLGLQEVPLFWLFDRYSMKDVTIGYAPRYFDYKTSIDVVNGALRTELKDWISAFNSSFFDAYFNKNGIFQINKDFFKVNANIVNSVFFLSATESVNSDQFIINSNISFKAVRNLDYDGLPKGN